MLFASGWKIYGRFSKEFKIDSTNNNFHFDNQFFLQTKGTSVALTDATQVMDFLEEKLHSVMPAVFDGNLNTCFIFWTRSKEDQQKFLSNLNSLHVSLKFTMEMNHIPVLFFGPEVKRINKNFSPI